MPLTDMIEVDTLRRTQCHYRDYWSIEQPAADALQHYTRSAP